MVNCVGCTDSAYGWSLYEVDYYLFNKQHYITSKLDQLVDIRLLAIVAWVLGSLTSFLTSYTGITLTTVSAIDGLLMAGIVHYIGDKFFYEVLEQKCLFEVNNYSLGKGEQIDKA